MNCIIECDGALDIGVVIDVSGSILQERFPLVKNFVRNILNQLEIRPGKCKMDINNKYRYAMKLCFKNNNMFKIKIQTNWCNCKWFVYVI